MERDVRENLKFSGTQCKRKLAICWNAGWTCIIENSSKTCHISFYEENKICFALLTNYIHILKGSVCINESRFFKLKKTKKLYPLKYILTVWLFFLKMIWNLCIVPLIFRTVICFNLYSSHPLIWFSYRIFTCWILSVEFLVCYLQVRCHFSKVFKS